MLWVIWYGRDTVTSLQSADKSDTISDVFNPEFIMLGSQLQRTKQREQGYSASKFQPIVEHNQYYMPYLCVPAG